MSASKYRPKAALRSAKPASSRVRRLSVESLESRWMMAVQQTGLLVNDEAAFDGYTLFTPSQAKTTYLIDNNGTVINTWTSQFNPGLHARLLPDGNLLRGGSVGVPNMLLGDDVIPVNANGVAGVLEMYSWEGDLLWSYSLNTFEQVTHHDFEVLPNGNIIVLAWEYKTPAEAAAAGHDPMLFDEDAANEPLIPDSVLELQPNFETGGADVVWEWHVWDHLVQEFDDSKDNYLGPNGVQEHPELIDLNYSAHALTGSGVPREDFTHANSIDYNAELDAIMISLREYNEIIIIDHSTTTEEAAGHTGGNFGKGGDILYRYGNPATYDRGTHANDRVSFWQHDANWLSDGNPLTVDPIIFFNNGTDRPGLGNVSSADEFTPPLQITDNGGGNITYAFPELGTGETYGPDELDWTYQGGPALYSPIISGAQRLPNGNTFITFGTSGSFVEVTPGGQIVWRYVNPILANRVLGKFESPPPLGAFGNTFQNLVFRATKYAPDFPGFAGRDLTPQFRDTIGLVDRSRWTWYLNNEIGGGLTSLNVFKTPKTTANRIPLAGDWNGDGIDTIGVYDPVARRFTLYNETDGTTDTAFSFRTSINAAGWKPIVGDWDGDGIDTVGFYDPARSRWHLFDSNSSSPDGLLTVQTPRVPKNWLPIVGDWDSDGDDTIGLYDNLNNTWYLRNENDNVIDDLIVFSSPESPTTWIPIIGDWNDDGQDSIGLFDQFTSTWYLNNKNDGSIDDLTVFQTPIVPRSWRPIIGNWDGSGIHGGGSGVTALSIAAEGESLPAVGDMGGLPTLDTNGDGALTARDALAIVNALNVVAAGGNSDVAALDVNGDGRLSASDALAVINELNLRAAGEPADTGADSVDLALLAEPSQRQREGEDVEDAIDEIAPDVALAWE